MPRACWANLQHARAPGLLPQSFGKYWANSSSLSTSFGFGTRERQFLGVSLKIAIEILRPCTDETAGQNVEDFRIKSQRAAENRNAATDSGNAAPDRRAALSDCSGDKIADAHEQATFNTNRPEDAISSRD
jgi:hypothetical protein